MLAWPSGGRWPAERLPRNFYRQYIEAAQRRGMAAVVETDDFARSIERNPSNRHRLLAMDPQAFIGVMSHWETAFTRSAALPIAGCVATNEQWGSIQAPTVVVAGCDPMHPTEAAQKLQKLIPHCELHGPVIPRDEWDRVFHHNPYPVTSKLQGERVAPVWLDFLRRLDG